MGKIQFKTLMYVPENPTMPESNNLDEHLLDSKSPELVELEH